MSPEVLEGRPRLFVHLGAWLLVGVLVTLLLNTLVGLAWLAAACFALPLSLAAAPMSISGFYLSRALPLRPDSLTRVAGTVGSAAIVTGALWAAVGYGWWLALHAMAISGIHGRRAGARVATTSRTRAATVSSCSSRPIPTSSRSTSCQTAYGVDAV